MYPHNVEIFHVNGWLFINDPLTNKGTVYFPKGETTLSIASNYGDPGVSFASKEEAIAYFAKTPVHVN